MDALWFLDHVLSIKFKKSTTHHFLLVIFGRKRKKPHRNFAGIKKKRIQSFCIMMKRMKRKRKIIRHSGRVFAYSLAHIHTNAIVNCRFKSCSLRTGAVLRSVTAEGLSFVVVQYAVRCIW